MRRNAEIIGLLVVCVGWIACPASALTLGEEVLAAMPADSLLSGPASNPALEAYVRDGAVCPSDSEEPGKRLPEENTSQELIYYVSGIASPMASFVLDRSNQSAAAPPTTEPVPEPAAGLLLLGGLGLIGLFKRRRCS